MKERNQVITVSQLNELIKTMFDYNPFLNNVCVLGEISNFTNHYKTGHLYFTLKDEKALVKAVMFKTYASNLAFVPQNNMKVLLYGRVSVFERDGVYQIYASHMEQFGVGDLYLKFEEMKKRLSSQGLFDDSHKKAIPPFPKRIGIITSPKAAAVADMKNIICRRYPLCEIHIYPALVQGPSAAGELCDGIIHFDNDKECDLIIIGRGGGSIEDLWAFNDEKLAKTIYSCNTPVISAVGHETDFTICDFVSDLRAPTPSAAAELAVPDIQELKNQLDMLKSTMTVKVSAIMTAKLSELSSLRERQSLKSPMFYVDKRQELLLNAEMRINGAFSKITDSKSALLSKTASRLHALNPMAVLARGYGAVFDQTDSVISSTKNLKKGQNIKLTFYDGSANAIITDIYRQNLTEGE